MRIFRLIATPIILLGLLALLIWGANWGWKELTSPLPSPSPTPCVTQTAEIMSTANVTVRVFNGGFTGGLANREARRLTESGFNVVRIDNTEERIRGTVIRANERQKDGEVRIIRSYFINPTIEWDDRVDGTVDVMLGTDFEGAPTEGQISQITAPGGVICMPPVPSEPASPSVSASPQSPETP